MPASHKRQRRPLRTPLQTDVPPTLLTSTHRVTNLDQRAITKHMSGKFVGPIPVEQWLEEFAPAPEGAVIPDEVSFEKVAGASKETEMYAHFIHACQNIKGESIFIADTSTCADPATKTPNDTNGLSPDLMFYDTSRPRGGKVTDFATAELFGEFKFTELADAFCDDGCDAVFPFESNSEMGWDTRGQIIAYANALLHAQFRLFCFSFLVMGPKARLMRWDRAGVVVSEAFNFVERPVPLAQFVWRYGRLSSSQRGYDANVVHLTPGLASESDMQKARKKLFLEPHQSLCLLRMSPHSPSDHPLPRGAAKSVTEADEWQYIVAVPDHRERCPIGKATRSIFVYDRWSGAVHHIKDTWRVNVPEREEEADIIRKLHAAKVPNIDDVLCASDVLQGESTSDTAAQRYAYSQWVHSNKATTPFRYYRLVSAKLGRPLTTFVSSRELVQAVGDAVEAQLGAERAGYRHHDISVGNILIAEDGRGMLIDWDSAVKVEDIASNVPREDLVGTWQFTSVSRLRNRSVPHLLMDDSESFFWVLLWMALKYCRHSLSADELSDTLKRTFDFALQVEGIQYGGRPKMGVLTDGSIEGGIGTSFLPPPLQNLLAALVEGFTWRYRGLPRMPSEDMPEYEILMDAYEAQRKIREESIAVLRDGMWMLSEFRSALKGSGWPRNDVAVANPLRLLSPTAAKRCIDRTSEIQANKMAPGFRYQKKRRTSTCHEVAAIPAMHEKG